MLLPCKNDKTFEQTPALLRRRRGRKSRARSLCRIRRQRELGHGEQFTFDVKQRQIHLVPRIRENAVAEHALDQPFGLRLRIAALDADQRKDPAPDGADDLSIDLDARLGDALNEGYHASVILTVTRA
jgi:hypothetical protein